MPSAAAMATPAAEDEMPVMNPEGVAWEFFAMGSLADHPEGELVLAISRVTYEPGVNSGAISQPGPQVAMVEAGAFTLRGVDGPPVTIARGFGEAIAAGEEPTFETLGPGDVTEVAAGDAVSFPIGNVTEISNQGDVPATVLLGVVASAGAGA